MLRVGHISYSNCVPVHCLLLEGEGPEGIELRAGIPSVLNRELEAGTIDVAPSSSIEYARHADRYRLLPGFAIAADGPVESILFECDGPLEALDGEEVALPTASATSVVLLRILLETRLGVRPRYRWFEQSDTADPVREGAAAALWIGDVALRRGASADGPFIDLGEVWKEWTGLPFVYAVWQVSAGPEKDPELRTLHATLTESLGYFERNVETYAERLASRFGMGAERLARYWRALEYVFDDRLERGLLHYYRLAHELGEAPAVASLRWVSL